MLARRVTYVNREQLSNWGEARAHPRQRRNRTSKCHKKHFNVG
jgi:hypothetical protein